MPLKRDGGTAGQSEARSLEEALELDAQVLPETVVSAACVTVVHKPQAPWTSRPARGAV